MANLLDNAKNNITNVASDFSQNVNNSVNTFSTNVSDIYSDSASSLDNFAGKNTPDSNSIFAKELASLEKSPTTILEGYRLSYSALLSLKNSGEYMI